MAYISFITTITIILFISYTCGQKCEQSSNVARFDCYPEKNVTQDNCLLRKCCWRPPSQQNRSRGFRDPNVPYCYYPSDFPTYKVTSNQATDFGQRIRILRSQTTYMPHDILDLTVDIIYETQQRLRIRIYDSTYRRYEVPLNVPSVEKKADTTDYDVVVKSDPFSILVTRKSNSMVLYVSMILILFLFSL